MCTSSMLCLECVVDVVDFTVWTSIQQASSQLQFITYCCTVVRQQPACCAPQMRLCFAAQLQQWHILLCTPASLLACFIPTPACRQLFVCRLPVRKLQPGEVCRAQLMSTLHHTSGRQRSFQDNLCRQPAAQLTPVPHTNQTYADASCIFQWPHSTFSNLDVCAKVRNCYCCCHCCFSLLLQPTPLLCVIHTAPNMQHCMLKMIEPVELLFSKAADSSSLQHAAAVVPSIYTVCIVALP